MEDAIALATRWHVMCDALSFAIDVFCDLYTLIISSDICDLESNRMLSPIINMQILCNNLIWFDGWFHMALTTMLFYYYFSTILWFSMSGDHLQEDLDKFGY